MASFPAPIVAPLIEVPPSAYTVDVSIIDTTSTLYPPTSLVFEASIGGHQELVCPCFSFLIVHHGRNGERKLLFDLGTRKDYENLSPAVRSYTAQVRIVVEKDILDILGDEPIEAVIWSHHHFDHIGDASLFPLETNVIVGPGFKDTFVPGYPANPDSWILESDYQGRLMHEVDFENGEKATLIGGFKAFDYFGDGSFYLLDCPGHAVGHIMGLARTTPSSFALLGADCCHHGGEFRPTEYLPLPLILASNDRSNDQRHSVGSGGICLGSLFLAAHPKKSPTEPFYKLKNPGVTHDHASAHDSVRKLAVFDANDDVLVLLAHDKDLPEVLDFWPKTLNDWKAKHWKSRLRWKFLNDFQLGRTEPELLEEPKSDIPFVVQRIPDSGGFA